MRVLAYCAAQFAESTRRAAGVVPLMAPPDTLDCAVRPDLLYLALHGRPGDAWLYGDANWPALRAAQINGDWRGVTVFAATCFLPETPFLEAFIRAGAMVIAGRGDNFTPARSLAGASLLGLWVRRGLEWGGSPAAALALGKARVRLQIGNRAAARDALAFQCYMGVNYARSEL